MLCIKYSFKKAGLIMKTENKTIFARGLSVAVVPDPFAVVRDYGGSAFPEGVRFLSEFRIRSTEFTH